MFEPVRWFWMYMVQYTYTELQYVQRSRALLPWLALLFDRVVDSVTNGQGNIHLNTRLFIERF